MFLSTAGCLFKQLSMEANLLKRLKASAKTISAFNNKVSEFISYAWIVNKKNVAGFIQKGICSAGNSVPFAVKIVSVS
jgi:hypothetical protein